MVNNAFAETTCNHFTLRSGRTGRRIDHSLDYSEAIETAEWLAQKERQVIEVYAHDRRGSFQIASALRRR